MYISSLNSSISCPATMIETTSGALLSTITLLALHPDEQEKAYQEILREAPCKEGLVRDYP